MQSDFSEKPRFRSKTRLPEWKTVFACRAREPLLLLLMGVIAFSIYSNTLENPFVFDDIPNILDNPHLRLSHFDFQAMKKAGFHSPSNNRPVANISFALNYRVHGYAVAGYHWVNILIHILTGMLLYSFTKITLALTAEGLGYGHGVKTRPAVGGRPPTAGESLMVPFFVALIWLVHPVQTQSVTYLVQRMNSMAAMFFLLALVSYAQGRLASEMWKKVLYFSGTVTAGLLALGSKEIAATLPFYLFLYEWFFFQNLSRKWLRRSFFPILALMATSFAAAYIFLGTSPVAKVLAGYAHRDFTLLQRVLTEFRVVLFYISLLIFPLPSRLNLDHDFPLSFSLIDPPTTLIAALVIIGLLVTSIYIAKKDRTVSFCLLWFLGNLMIESSIIGLELIFEHRTYLPSVAVCLIFVLYVHRYVRQYHIKFFVFCPVVLFCAVWTYERNAVWRDSLTLWADSAAKSPEKARPNNTLGRAFEERSLTQEAIAQYLKVMKIDPGYMYAYYNMGNIMRKLGRSAEAVDYYRKALHLVPDYKEAHNNLGACLLETGNRRKAIRHFNEALRIDPNFVPALRNLGTVSLANGDTDSAVDLLKRVLRINPEDAEAHYDLGNALIALARGKEAFSHFSEALQLKPSFAGAHNAIGILWAKSGRLDLAARHFSAALVSDPGDPVARDNLKKARRLMGQGAADEGKGGVR